MGLTGSGKGAEASESGRSKIGHHPAMKLPDQNDETRSRITAFPGCRGGIPLFSSWFALGPFNEHGEWSPKEYRLVTQRPQFVYLRLLGSTSGGGNLRVEI